ncbi:hypothetical protein B5P43_34850 [Bacillus sp. SRB_336]|nr:hypothetical protein B5P43_34850 [Bacillus sp. SRB_336]
MVPIDLLNDREPVTAAQTMQDTVAAAAMIRFGGILVWIGATMGPETKDVDLNDEASIRFSLAATPSGAAGRREAMRRAACHRWP